MADNYLDNTTMFIMVTKFIAFKFRDFMVGLVKTAKRTGSLQKACVMLLEYV